MNKKLLLMDEQRKCFFFETESTPGEDAANVIGMTRKE